jgi:hypothetical protein
MMGQVKNILIYLSVISPLIPLSMFLIGGKKPLSIIIKGLLLYFILSLSTDLICLSFIFKTYNNFIIEIYSVVEILIIVYFYKRIWNKSGMNLIFNLLSISILAVSLLSWFYLPKELSMLKNFIPASRSLIIVVISVVYFFQLIDNLNLPSLTGYYFFWFNSAFFVYFSVLLIVLLFKNYIFNSHSSQSVQNLWLLHNSFHIVYNSLLAVGLYKWKTDKI